MYFYTNPLEIPGTDGAGGTILDMKCEVFTLWDDLQQKNQSVIHYSIEREIQIRDPVDDGKVPKLYVNRTELNKQYFKIDYSKELEFLNLESTKLYLRKQGPKYIKLDVPRIRGYDDFHQFRGQVPSNLLAEAEPQVIGASYSVPTQLNTKPLTKVYLKRPKPDHWTLFGYPVSFINKAKHDQFEYKAMNERIPTLQLDEEEQKAD